MFQIVVFFRLIIYNMNIEGGRYDDFEFKNC